VTDLRLVAVDGEQTVQVGPLHDIAEAARAFADAVDAGKIQVERLLLIGIVEGAVSYTAWGQAPSVLEATGLLELASRKIERDVLERE
jgi:hypothetical protein